MILGKLDLPDPLLDAAKRGDLLVFAGAGVSMGGHSRYPSFRDLVRLIEKNTGRRRKKEEIDRFLGLLDQDGTAVHECTKKLLTNPKSRPNPIHRDIVRLFPTAQSVRVVTTNFDDHFTTVAQDLYPNAVDIYRAPALPLGDGFTGIVYVHGSVVGPASRLVLTDRDFGHAYSSEGWARRFLSDALGRYTVLFIGYSHSDPPMHYVTRGLKGKQGCHYAISPAVDIEKWRRLGIEPILYRERTKRNPHRAIHNAIAAWADNASMKALDHKRRIAALLKLTPADLASADDDYLRRCFRDRALLPFFYGDGLKACWLLWAEAASLLTPAFTAPTKDETAYAQHVAHWFARHAVENHNESLAVYVRAGMMIPEHLWYQIGLSFHAGRRNSQPGRSQWSAQLCIHWRPSYSTDYLEYAMTVSAEQGDFPTALMLLDFLSTPRIIHEHSFMSYSDPAAANKTSTKIRIPATHGTHWFEELWKKHLQPRLGDYASRLGEMATDKLEQAYELQAVHSAPDEPFDEVGWHRSAIEPNTQDDYRTEFHVLVDIARDCYEYLIGHDRSLALAFGVRWVKSRSPLLIRLAVHGMRADKRVSAESKMRWLIQHNLLAHMRLHHEVFLLIRETFPRAKPNTQKAVLNYVRKTTLADLLRHPDIDPSAFWHHEFSLLSVLDQATDGGCRRLRSRLVGIKRKFPRFRVSDDPEFTHWSSSGSVGSQSPVSAPELRARKVEDALRLITTFTGDRSHRFRRNRLISTLQSAVAEDSAWGLEFAGELKKRKHVPDDVWPAIVRGWSNANMPPKIWHNVLVFLSAVGRPRLPMRETAQLLFRWVQKGGSLPKPDLLNAERLAFVVLAQARRSSSRVGASGDWYSWAINDVGGILCEFFVHIVSEQRLRTNPRPKKLPAQYRREFSRMVGGRTLADQAGRTVLAYRLHYFHAWDPTWVQNRLLSAFDWERNRLRATQVWQGFLAGGKWSSDYLQRLIPYYMQSLDRMTSNGALAKQAEQLVGHIASLCLQSASRRARGPLLVKLFRVASDETRLKFATSIRAILDGATPKERHIMWASWLKSYWQDRNLGKPTPLTPTEVNTMIGWCPLLGTDFSDAVEVLTRSKTSGKVDLFYLHSFPTTGLSSQFPAATARFLVYILQNHGRDYLYAKDVLKVAMQLVAEPGTHELLAEIIEQLAYKGCIEEAETLSNALSVSKAPPATAAKTP